MFEQPIEEVPPEKKKKKEKKKKRVPKLAKKITVIKNADKHHNESWNSKSKSDIANFPSPSRICLLGSCGVGKSMLIKNLICHQRPMFDEVYLVHEDAGVTDDYKGFDLTDEFDEIPDLDFWDYDGKFKKRALIIDDLELTAAHKQRKKNLAIAFRYASTHKGLTIYFAHQSWFDVMPLVKKMSNVFIIWKPRARNELTMIENRVGMEKGELKKIFKTVATGHRDSICIDMNEGTPAFLRKNIWEELDREESDSESD